MRTKLFLQQPYFIGVLLLFLFPQHLVRLTTAATATDSSCPNNHKMQEAPDTKRMVEQILADSSFFENEDMKEACSKLVHELNETEQLVAAQTSYAYWLYTTTENTDSKANLTEEELTRLRIQFAMREAQRHYVGENQNYDQALTVLKQAIAWRQKYNIPLIRRVRDINTLEEDTSLSSDEKELVKRYHGYIEQELKHQLTITSGFDRDHRAVLVRFSRGQSETTENTEAYLIAQLYVAERACAAVEYQSITTNTTTNNHHLPRGGNIVCLSEYANYSSANAPPTSVLIESLKLLQRLYPERLKQMVFLDAPFWLRAIITLLKPFMATATKEKIAMVSGPADKETVLTPMMDVSQAVPWMNPEDFSMAPPERVNVLAYLNQYLFETYRDNTPPDTTTQ